MPALYLDGRHHAPLHRGHGLRHDHHHGHRLMIAQGHCVRHLSGVHHDPHRRCAHHRYVRRSVPCHRDVVIRQNGVPHRFVPVPMRVEIHHVFRSRDGRRHGLRPRGAHDHLRVRHCGSPSRYCDRPRHGDHQNDLHPRGRRRLSAEAHRGHLHRDRPRHVHSGDGYPHPCLADADPVPHDHHEGHRHPSAGRSTSHHQHRCVLSMTHGSMDHGPMTHGPVRHHCAGLENHHHARGRHPGADRRHDRQWTGDHSRDDRRHGDGDPAQQTFVQA